LNKICSGLEENIQTLKLDAYYSILVDQFDHLFSMLLNINCSGLKKKYRQIIFMSKYKREKSQIIEIEEEISILVKKSLQLEYLFIISEIFLEFIYKLHVLKMSMKPNHP
jgi:hypothetical protein